MFVKLKSLNEEFEINGIDRHRIKFFVDKTRPNYTDFDFEYINEPVTTNPDECKG